MRRLVTALVTTTLLVLAPLVLVQGAAAAAEGFSVESSDPADDARVATLPATVSVTFDAELTDQSTLQVVNGDGQRLDDGDVQVAGRRVLVGVTDTSAPEGTYRLVYRAVSSLGEELGGEVQFRVDAEGAAPADPSASPSGAAEVTPAPDPSASSDVRITEIEEGGESKWAPLWILGFLVITSALILYIVKAGLTSAPGEDDD